MLSERKDIEYALLAKAITDQEVAIMLSEYDEDDFSDQYARMLWNAISAVVLGGGEVSFPVIKAEMARINIPRDAISIILSETGLRGDFLTTKGSAFYHGKQLKDISYKCTLDEMAERVKGMLNDNAPLDEMDKCIEDALARRTQVMRFDDLNEDESLEEMLSHSVMLPTRIYELDKVIGGFEGGELTTIAARPGRGKTTIAHYLLDTFASSGKSGMMASLEMNKVQTMLRIIASRLDKTYAELRGTPALGNMELKKIISQWGGRIKISIDSSDIKTIIQRARYLHRHGKLDFLMIDHIGLCKAEGNNPNERISNITGPLKQFALTYNVPVIAFSQMNREIEKRGGLPSLSDLRDSGSIEQDSNKILFLHMNKDGDRSFVIAKNTFGPQAEVPMYLDQKYYKVLNGRPITKGITVNNI